MLGLTVSSGVVCRTLLLAETHLWAFTAAEGGPPHNNATERALRRGVLWRKPSYGTGGESTSRIVERMLSLVATCRQRDRDVLGFLTACLHSRLDGTHAPSLLA